MAEPLPAFLAVSPADLLLWLQTATAKTKDQHELRCITALRWLVLALPPKERPFDLPSPPLGADRL